MKWIIETKGDTLPDVCNMCNGYGECKTCEYQVFNNAKKAVEVDTSKLAINCTNTMNFVKGEPVKLYAVEIKEGV